MDVTTSKHAHEAGATAALLSLVLDRAAREPLGRQLYLRVRDMILEGRLTAGVKLPSSRRLADDMGVSRTVTLFAYDQLAADGYLAAQHGSGHYVNARSRHRVDADPPAAPETPTAPDTMRDRPFDPDAPPASLFPRPVWARLMARAWQQEGAAATAFDEWAGLLSLRTAIAGYLGALQGLDCTAEHVVITAGTADALQLISRGLGASNAQIWVEDPGHVGARQTLHREGLEIIPVPVDAEGLDIAEGRRLAPKARFALVTPSRQFPSGAPLSLPRRKALIDWAAKTGALIIADDYDSELRFTGQPVAALASLDDHGVVLSVGSFSKITFPGLRLGYIVGPAALMAQLVRARAREGSLVATAAQPALAEFISEGALARHLRHLRAQMALRREALATALKTGLGDAITLLPQEVGLHIVVVLSDALAPGWLDTALSERAARQGLRLDPLSNHAAAMDGRRGFLLGYAGWEETELKASAAALTALLTQLPPHQS